MPDKQNALLQISPFAIDCGQLIGRDPREVPSKDWRGRRLLVGLKAIRAKCKDCSGGDITEIRKCVVTDCPLWALRMGTVPRGFNLARQGQFPSDDAISDAPLPEMDEIENITASGAQNEAEGTR